MILPGWDSTETVTKIHRFFEIGGIVCLALLVLFEAFAYAYGHRLETLSVAAQQRLEKLSAAAQQQILKDALDRQSEQLASQYGRETEELKKQAGAVAQELAIKKQAEQESERIRHAPPKIIVGLKPAEKGKVYVLFESQNLVPFEYRYVICTRNNQVVSGIPMGMSKAYPHEGQAAFSSLDNIQLDRVQDSYLELRFTFRSLSYEELRLPELAGQIVVKYRLGPDAISLQPIQE